MRLLVVTALASLALALSGCAIQYTYDGVKYPGRGEALAAQQRDIDKALAGIVPVQNPLGGSATVILPSLAVANARGVIRMGSPGPMQDEIASFIAESLVTSWYGNVEALRRGRVFSSVSVASVDNPAEVSKTAGGDTVIWFDLVDPNTAQWYGFDRDGKVVALPVDFGAPLGTPRMQKWVNLVSEALAGVGLPAPSPPVEPAKKRT